jgi:long-chain acyl-CoA synthetase
VKSYIDRINQDLPAGIRVKKYVNLYKEFDPEEGELTRTRKLRRAFLENRYYELILAINNNKTEVPIEVEGKKQNGKTRTMKTTIKINSFEGDD